MDFRIFDFGGVRAFLDTVDALSFGLGVLSSFGIGFVVDVAFDTIRKLFEG